MFFGENLCSADPNTGNILNFNVGQNVDLMVPRVRAQQPLGSLEALSKANLCKVHTCCAHGR